MAFEWVNSASIIVATTVKAVITLPSINASDINKVRDNLTLMGFLDFEIEIA